ncbi:hypothetical protein M6D93_05740 [Jatrophihabitans telluris]|uniref:Pilus assembly protein n=1 Tax=Jatrophihabitans telluris TaxID=2038343 RepID=A0ABY4R0U4_9ACTN|nr:hypothetical protein [Jatrophihabitans telluris]UQX89508.1 hypothetical protein M6D93_05740 [Jatrophihabitans telluris]
MSSTSLAPDTDAGTAYDDDAGNAIVEFVFLALLIMVPLVYFIVAVAEVQRTRLSVTAAARDVGRALATGRDSQDSAARANVALRVALAGHGLNPSQVQLRYVSAAQDCSATAIAPDLEPGAEFAVCVIRRERLPGIPSVVTGRGITLIGRYVVHVDDFRDAR